VQNSSKFRQKTDRKKCRIIRLQNGLGGGLKKEPLSLHANLYTVSIGFEGRLAEKQGGLSAAQLEAGIWLIAHIREEIHRLYSVRGDSFKIDRQHIVGHHEITPRTRPHCPGPQFPFDAIIQLLQEKPTEPIEPDEPCIPPENAEQLPNAHVPSSWAQETWAWAVNNGLTDGTNPRNPATREQMVTILHRYHTRISNLQ